MKRKIIKPSDFPCALVECPPGPFLPVDTPTELCFKSEYATDPPRDNRLMAFNAAGEFYCGEGLVWPVEMVEEEI